MKTTRLLFASTAIPLLAVGCVVPTRAGERASSPIVLVQALPGGDAPARRPDGAGSAPGQEREERPRREREGSASERAPGERRQGAQTPAGEEREPGRARRDRPVVEGAEPAQPRRERPAADGADPAQPRRERPAAAEGREPSRPREPAAGSAQPAPRSDPAARPAGQDAPPTTRAADPVRPRPAAEGQPGVPRTEPAPRSVDQAPAAAPRRETETDRRPGDAPRRDSEIERRPGEGPRRDVEIERRPGEGPRRDVEIERRPGEGPRRDVEIERRPGDGPRRDVEIERRPGEGPRRDVEIERRPGEGPRRDVEIERRPGEGPRRDVEIERRGRDVGDARDLRLDDLRGQRRERVEEGGRRVIIEEPGNRTIVREGGRVIIRHDETQRFRRGSPDADVRVERRGENEVTIIRRPNGVEILTVRDSEGNLVRRVRREPAGAETVLIENVARDRPRRTIVERTVELPPVQLRIPREKYVVEVDRATRGDLDEAFSAPPVERIERNYTLDEVRQSQDLRQRVRRVDVDTVTFEFGSWELAENQVGALTGVAEAIARAIERNPSEIFLIEGHTDAVGPDVDNLTLSDRRAETVANVLSERFKVPAENLTTQGYGEQYLKINSQEPERQNRRVAVRRITPLLKGAAAAP